MDNTTPYREVTEDEATAAGLPGQPDTTYRDEGGDTVGYNAGTRTFWKLGRSPFGADPVPRDRSAIGRAIAQAQETLEAAIEREGGRVLCAVMIVQADGLTPNGGVDATADDVDGPQTPDDMLSFVLVGVGQLAARYGLPFSVMGVGQG